MSIDDGDRDIATRRQVRKQPNKAPDQFHSGLVGMGAAKTALGSLIKRKPALALSIYRAVAEAGLRGAPALGHLAGYVTWKAGERDLPTPPGALKLHELRIVEERGDLIVERLGLSADQRAARLPTMSSAAPAIPNRRPAPGGIDPYA